ncbi:unnamed protein product [Rhodiola kirilowii]
MRNSQCSDGFFKKPMNLGTTSLGTTSFFEKEVGENSSAVLVEAGPRLSFTTAWSSNAVSICQACGLSEVTRLESSRRRIAPHHMDSHKKTLYK